MGVICIGAPEIELLEVITLVSAPSTTAGTNSETGIAGCLGVVYALSEGPFLCGIPTAP